MQLRFWQNLTSYWRSTQIKCKLLSQEHKLKERKNSMPKRLSPWHKKTWSPFKVYSSPLSPSHPQVTLKLIKKPKIKNLKTPRLSERLREKSWRNYWWCTKILNNQLQKMKTILLQWKCTLKIYQLPNMNTTIQRLELTSSPQLSKPQGELPRLHKRLLMLQNWRVLFLQETRSTLITKSKSSKPSQMLLETETKPRSTSLLPTMRTHCITNRNNCTILLQRMQLMTKRENTTELWMSTPTSQRSLEIPPQLKRLQSRLKLMLWMKLLCRVWPKTLRKPEIFKAWWHSWQKHQEAQVLFQTLLQLQATQTQWQMSSLLSLINQNSQNNLLRNLSVQWAMKT